MLDNQRKHKPTFTDQVVFAISSESINFTASIITSILLARLLTLHDRGILASLNALLLLFSIASSFSASALELQANALIKRLNSLLFLVIRDTIILSCLIIPVMVATLNLVGLSHDLNSDIYVLLAINYSSTCAFLILQRIALGLGLANEINSSAVLAVLIYATAIVIASVLGQLNLNSAFFMSTLLQIVSLVVLLSRILKKSMLKHSWPETYSPIQNIGIRKRLNALTQDLLSTLTQRSMPIFVVTFFGPDSAAIFRIASTASDLSLKLPRILTQVQRSTILNKRSGWHRVFKLIRIFTLISFLICTFLFFLGPTLMSVAFTKDYSSAALPALLLCVANLPWTIFILFANQINLRHRYPNIMLLPSAIPLVTLSILWLLQLLDGNILSSLNQLILCMIAAYTIMMIIAIAATLRMTRLKPYFLLPRLRKTKPLMT